MKKDKIKELASLLDGLSERATEGVIASIRESIELHRICPECGGPTKRRTSNPTKGGRRLYMRCVGCGWSGDIVVPDEEWPLKASHQKPLVEAPYDDWKRTKQA